ncbi:molybdate ABC transporter substrate-binding protein [Polynucleobacter necessarius]|uniref:molybdate ABC transporter substrate-binding protein n=1 Tax=Polynucleobacter necessarius TaxID=576610 RepID=UPI0018D55067|nr:molybdate ABC transporter substrate-binding protein [Polynucleobacter necessarius]
MHVRLIILIAALFLILQSAVAQTVTVAVAANMKDAFSEIAQEFKANHKSELRVVYGSSGNFAAQIQNGAPFQLFIAADERFPLELYKNGKTLNEGSVYAIGKLVLIAKANDGLPLTANKTEIATAIQKARRIAIAKPDLAPYGKAAVEYLKAEGLWDLAKDKIVYGDNIGVATTYVVTGAADIGFTALSLAKATEVAKDTRYVLVNAHCMHPLNSAWS